MFGAVTIFREQRDTDSGVQANCVLLYRNRFLQLVEDQLGQLCRLIGLFDIRLYQDKLVAPRRANMLSLPL